MRSPVINPGKRFGFGSDRAQVGSPHKVMSLQAPDGGLAHAGPTKSELLEAGKRGYLSFRDGAAAEISFGAS